MAVSAGERVDNASDSQCIQAAYQAKLQLLYGALFEACVAAQGQEAQLKPADDAFRRGVSLARQARDRALKLL
ncbi:MAG: hypothetical protein RLZZ468_109 [Cyanobacteriota bacterium]|jgi:uncharacterized protein